MELLEMPADLPSGVILAIEAAQKAREARLMTVSIAAIAILAIGLAVGYFKLEGLAIIAAMIMGVFAWFFTAAEIRQKRAIYTGLTGR